MPRGSGALRLGAAAGLALQVSALVSCDPNAIGPRQLCPAFNNCPESCAPQEGVDEGMCRCGCPLNYMTRKVADIAGWPTALFIGTSAATSGSF